jgi:hypothetical protein
MKILENYNDLVGKKIVFSHMAQFAEQITLATEDGCVLMATFDLDEDWERKEIRVLHDQAVLRVLKSDHGRWMREELGELGIFDIDAYTKEQEEIAKKKHEEWKKKQALKEKEEYERLKKKFKDQ